MATSQLIDKAQAQAILEHFIHPVLVIDQDLNPVTANNSLKSNPLLWDNCSLLAQHSESLVRGGQELTYLKLDGHEYMLTAMPMTHGRSLIRVAKAGPSALAKRYNNMLNAIDQMSDALVIIEQNDEIELVNDQFQRIFPLPIEQGNSVTLLTDMLQSALSIVYPDSPVLITKYRRFLLAKHHKKAPLTFSFTLPNGQFYNYRDSISSDGERIGLLINETAFKELNQQLELAFSEAMALSHAKSNFMAAMSHEVKTPLNAIIGLLELSMATPQLMQNEYIQRIDKNAKILLRLVNDVLDFTKFDAQKVSLNLVKCDLRRFCENIIDNFTGQAQLKQTDILLFVDPQLPATVIVDDLRLTQVLTNLISNALKFNHDAEPEVRIEVFKDPLTHYVTFQVIDNGIGIRKSEQNEIFSRFSQANADIHRTYGGSGIGLTICQKICQLMKGDIYVESEKGKGAKFVVQLPLSFVERAAADIKPQQYRSIRQVFSNDKGFIKALRYYQQYLAIDIYYLAELPAEIQSDTLFCLNPIQLEAKQLLSHSTLHNIVLLNTDETGSEQAINSISRQPLKLKEFELLLYSSEQLRNQTDPRQAAPAMPIDTDLRILVVEDNPENIFVIERQLERLQLRASYCMSAEDAVIHFEQNQFDVVISDFQMPKVSGSQLVNILREIEQSEGKPRCFIAIYTADKTDKCRTECYQAGADSVLMKPLTLAELTDFLRGCSAITQPTETLSMAAALQKSAPTLQESVFGEECLLHEVEPSIGLGDGQVVFDLERFYEVVGDITKEDEYDYISQFSLNLAEVLRLMEHCINCNDIDKLVKYAHSLKSSALIVGAQPLSQSCDALEAAFYQHPGKQDLLVLWLNVKVNIDGLMHALQTYLVDHAE